MLTFLADENFNNAILRGLLRRKPALSIVRTQDTPLAGTNDPTLLAWAAEQGYLLLTHDVTTMIAYAQERIAADQPISGLIAVGVGLPIGTAIEELLLIAEYSTANDWIVQVWYLPLR